MWRTSETRTKKGDCWNWLVWTTFTQLPWVTASRKQTHFDRKREIKIIHYSETECPFQNTENISLIASVTAVTTDSLQTVLVLEVTPKPKTRPEMRDRCQTSEERSTTWNPYERFTAQLLQPAAFFRHSEITTRCLGKSWFQRPWAARNCRRRREDDELRWRSQRTAWTDRSQRGSRSTVLSWCRKDRKDSFIKSSLASTKSLKGFL